MFNDDNCVMTVNDRKATILLVEKVYTNYQYTLQIDFDILRHYVSLAVHKHIGGFASVKSHKRTEQYTYYQIYTQEKINRYQQIMVLASILNSSYTT